MLSIHIGCKLFFDPLDRQLGGVDQARDRLELGQLLECSQKLLFQSAYLLSLLSIILLLPGLILNSLCFLVQIGCVYTTLVLVE